MRFLSFPTPHFVSKISFEWSHVKLNAPTLFSKVMNHKIEYCNAHCELNSQK